MTLRVGMVGCNAGWKLLLNQVGVPCSIITDDENIDELSAMIVGEDVSSSNKERIREFVQRGGGVLGSAKAIGELFSIPLRHQFIRSLVPDSQFAGIGMADIFLSCTIAKEANALSADGKYIIMEREMGGGYIVALPFDAGELILDSRQAVKSFYAKSKKLPFEHVSLVSKTGIRKLVVRALEVLHHRRGIPFVHLWYYPENAPTIFSFRIDTDFCGKREIEELYDLSQRAGIPFSWFLDVETQQKHFDLYRSMNAQEIAVHCYRHSRYDSSGDAVSDIEQALAAMKRALLEPSGFAAPYGQWSAAVREAIDHFGFVYSSEFSYDYDNLPSTISTMFQIPVHPISIGTLRRLRYTDDEMHTYFMDMIRQKYHQRDPMIFYHHPKNAHLEILEQMFTQVKQLHVPVLRMIDYALWWKARNLISPNIQLHDNVCSVTTAQTSPTHWLHCTRGDGTEAFSPLVERIELDRLTWTPIPPAPELPSDISPIRKFNLWIPLLRVQDFLFKPFTR